jgi:hypothetical protein
VVLTGHPFGVFMSITWTLEEIEAKVRDLTSMPDESQITSVEIKSRINDFYRNRFPDEIDDKMLNGWYSKTIYATDSGDYDVSDEILKFYGNPVDNPAFIDSDKINIFQDASPFFGEYPILDTGGAYWITPPTLLIGTTTTKVANVAFSFRTNSGDYSYDCPADETLLSGDTVPQNKYGAWRLEVNSAGTISIVEADDNATGYETAAQAIQGLPVESSVNACMGYVTVIRTSGTFIPGTTALNASDVTVTFTDGWHSTRGRPDAALLEDDILSIRPKPDDTYVFKAYCKIKPTALSSDSSVPLKAEWGPMIAGGASLEIVDVDDPQIETISAYYQKYKSLINQRYTAQFFSGNQRTSPSF